MSETLENETHDDELLLEARGVSVQFGSQRVLRDINLKVARGETLAIIGESGCGKTVLLKAIIGLVRPKQGEMIFAGRNLATLDDRELARQRIRFGFVFQQAALFDSMTIAQNIAFPLRQHTDKTDAEDSGNRDGAFGRGRAAGNGLAEKTSGTIGRHAKTRGAGSGFGHESGSGAV